MTAISLYSRVANHFRAMQPFFYLAADGERMWEKFSAASSASQNNLILMGLDM